ncbi:MAG: AAA family ATPase [Pseudomonadota bacterium]
MYLSHFGIREKPFSITPDPRYLYMSKGHQEALAHLLYGISEGGGFVLLTGEVGTGKTSLCRCLLEQLPDQVDLALILNPRLSEVELLASICDELGIDQGPNPDANRGSLKNLTDRLNQFLLARHAKGRQVVVMIDEAQNLAPEVLELIRLLTNLETDKTKLLQFILVGQPELLDVLNRRDLRQLLQRVTARYHLMPLTGPECEAYIKYRLAVVGLTQSLFSPAAVDLIFRASSGVPRLINLICDRCLLGAFAQNLHRVDKKIARRAVDEVSGWTPQKVIFGRWKPAAIAASLVFGFVILGVAYQVAESQSNPSPRQTAIFLPVPEPSIAEETAAALTASLKQTEIVKRPRRAFSDPQAGEAETPDLEAERAATTLVPERQLGEVLKKGDAGHSLEKALHGLFDLWGRNYWVLPGLTACDRAVRAGLDCYRGNNGWAGLVGLNRPALVSLFGNSGRQVHALVRSIDGDRVTLGVNDQTIESTKEELAAYWSGEYLLFWQPPPAFKRALQMGVSGPDVVWLKEQLHQTTLAAQANANVDGEPDPTKSTGQRFDQRLHEAVTAFQEAHALRADGVVGVPTIIHLNSQRALGEVPLLTSPVSVRSR